MKRLIIAAAALLAITSDPAQAKTVMCIGRVVEHGGSINIFPDKDDTPICVVFKPSKAWDQAFPCRENGEENIGCGFIGHVARRFTDQPSGQKVYLIDRLKPTTGLPDVMLGAWCFDSNDGYTRGKCADPDSDGQLTVSRNSLMWMEDGCDFRNARRLKHSSYLIHTRCWGEGSSWGEKTVVKLIGGKLQLHVLHRSPDKVDGEGE